MLPRRPEWPLLPCLFSEAIVGSYYREEEFSEVASVGSDQVPNTRRQSRTVPTAVGATLEDDDRLCTMSTQSGMLRKMSVPVTTRLSLAAVEALDAAVASGVTPTRGAAVQEAVREWLANHGEEAITASYRHRYKTPDPDQGLIASLGEYSLKACLAASED